MTAYAAPNRRRRAALSYIRRVYDIVERMLWVVLAFMVVGAVIVIARAPENRAQFEREMAAEIANENRVFCENRGLTFGSYEHLVCTMDLNDLRARHERRFATTLDFP